MDTFILGKLGEVLAFARVGKDTVTKGQMALAKLVEEQDLAGLEEEFEALESSITIFATNEGDLDKVEKKAAESQSKLTNMRDIYVGGKWNEDDEVLEWMGFYTGAALVHWHLLSGASEAHEMDELETMSQEAIDFYSTLFTSDEEVLEKIGAERA